MAQNKNKAGQYAEAFLRAVESATPKEREARARALVSVAEKRGDRALLPSVLREIATRTLRREQKESVHVEVADESHAWARKSDIGRAVKEIGGDTRRTRTKTNPALVGGFRAEYHGVMYDASYQRFLVDLYRRLIS